jgi:hypothetical protein
MPLLGLMGWVLNSLSFASRFILYSELRFFLSLFDPDLGEAEVDMRGERGVDADRRCGENDVCRLRRDNERLERASIAETTLWPPDINALTDCRPRLGSPDNESAPDGALFLLLPKIPPLFLRPPLVPPPPPRLQSSDPVFMSELPLFFIRFMVSGSNSPVALSRSESPSFMPLSPIERLLRPVFTKFLILFMLTVPDKFYEAVRCTPAALVLAARMGNFLLEEETRSWT